MEIVRSDEESQKVASSEKLRKKILGMLPRINFISWSTLIIGVGVMLTTGFFYFVIQDDRVFQSHMLMYGLVGLILASTGFYMTRKVKALRFPHIDLSLMQKKIAILVILALLLGIIIGIPVILLSPIWGLILVGVFALLIIDLLQVGVFVWNSEIQTIITYSKASFPSIFKYLVSSFLSIFKYLAWLGLFLGAVWLIIALGPLWIIAIILLFILFILANR